jgi:hypothetical protein
MSHFESKTRKFIMPVLTTRVAVLRIRSVIAVGMFMVVMLAPALPPTPHACYMCPTTINTSDWENPFLWFSNG